MRWAKKATSTYFGYAHLSIDVHYTKLLDMRIMKVVFVVEDDGL